MLLYAQSIPTHSECCCVQSALSHSECCFVQIVSSAIVNAPPPQTFMKLLHKTSKADLVSKPQTREKMVRIFKGRLTGDKLLAQRQVPLTVKSKLFCQCS